MLDRRSNAYVEAMNGLLQQAKRVARCFRTATHFNAIAYLRMSKLKHLSCNPTLHAMPQGGGLNSSVPVMSISTLNGIEPYWATYHASEAHQDDYQQYDNPYELAQFLQERGLKYGYSTYWTAGVISVLTDHRTIIRHIYLEQGIPVRFKWLPTEQWYLPASYQGETLLLLTEAQAKTVDWSTLKQKYDLIPDRTLQYQDFIIFIFPENMANKMSNWSVK